MQMDLKLGRILLEKLQNHITDDPPPHPTPSFGVVGKVARNLGAWVALLLVSVLLQVCE